MKHGSGDESRIPRIGLRGGADQLALVVTDIMLGVPGLETTRGAPYV